MDENKSLNKSANKTLVSNNAKKKKKERTPEQEYRNYCIVHTVVGWFLQLFYPIKTYHRERIPEGACLICPNHTTLLDPPMACIALTRKIKVKIMAKKQLFAIPIIGWIIASVGAFPVDRGNNDVGAIKNALRALKDGYKLLMFPEGTRVKEGEVNEGKTGAAMFAMKTGSPVVPVFMTRKKRMFHKTTVIFGEPLYFKSAGKRPTKEELENATHEIIKNIYALENESN